jgi:hypothetical protein
LDLVLARPTPGRRRGEKLRHRTQLLEDVMTDRLRLDPDGFADALEREEIVAIGAGDPLEILSEPAKRTAAWLLGIAEHAPERMHQDSDHQAALALGNGRCIRIE